MPKYHTIFYTIIIFETLWEFGETCPTVCICKWKNGKQTVNCIKQNLSEIPDRIDSGTQVLDFNSNNLTILPLKLFDIKKLLNLQRLYLNNNKIKIIHDKTFEGLSNLIELDLSHNRLEFIPTNSLFECGSLMRLILNSNPLRILKKYSFYRLVHLTTLELSNCEITKIEIDSFYGLNHLEWLNLNDNNLYTIQGQQTLPTSLKGIELNGNLWDCNCNIIDFYYWLKQYQIPINIEPVCVKPERLLNRIIKTIDINEFACLPEIQPKNLYIELDENKNISFLCQVHSIPESKITWLFNGEILDNTTITPYETQLIYFIDEELIDDTNKFSELFIYNINIDNNGTFICNAENPAGTKQSNFTIKINKNSNDPIIVVVPFKLEYLLIAGTLAGVLLLIIIMIIVVFVIIKSRRNRRNNKNRTPPIDTTTTPQLELELKDNQPVKNNELIIYEANIIRAQSNQQLEQNPDLINGTEDFKNQQHSSPILQHFHQNILNDVRWNYCVDNDGYPIDYGLPKYQQNNKNFYQTLPHNKRGKKQKIVEKPITYDDDILSYYDNLRYTIDGYPVLTNCSEMPVSLPCCSIQWPVCLPANLHTINHNFDTKDFITKRCVSAQTDDNTDTNGDIDKNVVEQQNANDIVTESPDEGYEGEPSVV